VNPRRAYRVWQRHVKVYTKLYLSSLTLNFIEPILYLTAMGMGLGVFVKEMGGVPYINYIAPGIVAYSSMFATSGECTYGTFVRMTFQKTFDAILATPVNLNDLVAGEIMWGATKSALYGTVILAAISAMGLVGSPMVLAAIPVLFISGLIFAELAIMYVSMVRGIDWFNYYFTLVITPMFLFSGVFFPLSGLPAWVEKVAFFMPLYHLVNVLRELSQGRWPVGDILWLTVVAALIAPYPFRLMRRRIMSRG